MDSAVWLASSATSITLSAVQSHANKKLCSFKRTLFSMHGLSFQSKFKYHSCPSEGKEI